MQYIVHDTAHCMVHLGHIVIQHNVCSVQGTTEDSRLLDIGLKSFCLVYACVRSTSIDVPLPLVTIAFTTSHSCLLAPGLLTPPQPLQCLMYACVRSLY